MQNVDIPFSNKKNISEESIEAATAYRRLSFAYVGPSLKDGRIDAIVLADGLKGTARLVNRVAELVLGSQDGLTLQIDGEPSAGSFEVFVSIGHGLSYLGDSKILGGVLAVQTITGFSLRDAGRSIWSWFKKRKGRPITDDTDLQELFPELLNLDRALLIRIFNDPDVQAALRAALRPLRKEGIETYETRVNGTVVETVAKADLQAADSAELNEIVADEIKTLDIEKASFVPHLSWHLSDNGKPFDAKIEDPKLWARVAAGDKFGSGDKLNVDLHTSAERESNGRLKITKTVTKVRRIERAGDSQMELFPTQAETNSPNQTPPG